MTSFVMEQERLLANRLTLRTLSMTAAEFESLLEYSTSRPTGTYIGKRWKCDIAFLWAREVGWLLGPVWIVGEYAACETPDRVRLNWYRPVWS